MDDFTHECRWCHQMFPVGLLNGLNECPDCEHEQQNPEPDEPIAERSELSLIAADISAKLAVHEAAKRSGVK